ncbi:hypothetical protein [Effusibacillus consociatus]|uniref:Uncharacterized protein n=1 Tax=Effusibacillus consociatus TaxID=1117041 RepID=A0ABV9Q5R4_9BACL
MPTDSAAQISNGVKKTEQSALLDEFSYELFYTLDMLDLLPKKWSDKPHAYEKWARELLAPLKRKNANFTEVLKDWQSRVIRSGLHPSYKISDTVRKMRFEQLDRFRIWCSNHQDIIQKNAHHLLTSLLARAFAYVFPVRTLSDFYTELHKGEADAFSTEVIEERFFSDVEERYQELKEQGRITPRLKEMARDHLLNKVGIYRERAMKKMNGGEEE